MISIIIPTHNRSAKLARALAAAQIQSWQDNEIIVIDDASSDEEAAAIAGLVAKTKNARLLRNESNLGAPRSRNLGVEVARGEIIALLDSDDWWAPERLAMHAESFADPAIVLSYNRAFLTRNDENGVFATVNEPPARGRPTQVALAAWNFVGGCSSVCVRRSAFLEVGGFDPDLPSCQDWELWFRLGGLGRLAYIPQALTYVDFGPHERISTSREKVDAGHDVMARAARAFAMNENDRRYVDAHQHRVRARLETAFGEPGKALRELARSIRTKPTKQAIARLPAYIARYLLSLFGGKAVAP